MGQHIVPATLQQTTRMRLPLYSSIVSLLAERKFTRQWSRCVRAWLMTMLVAAIQFGAATAWSAEAQTSGLSARALENLTLQLMWLPQFQFAGYYAAQAKGFYQQKGLNVTLVPGGKDISPLATLLAGNAHFSVGDADLLVARLQGQPIEAMAAIFQHTPYVILSRDDSHIRSPGDLIAGRVDAMSAHATVEPYQLLAKCVVPATLRSAKFGNDFDGDISFITGAQLAQQPRVNAAFLRASLKGWDYALKHPTEAADLILKVNYVKVRGATREALLRQAEKPRSLTLPDVLDIGQLSAQRFKSIATTLVSQGLAPSDERLEGWLYAPTPKLSARLVRWLAVIGASFVAVAALVLSWNRQMRRSVAVRTRELQSEVTHRIAVQAELKVSQELVQRLFGTAASGLVMNTPSGKLVMANPAYCSIVGYSVSELQEIDTRGLTHPDDRAGYQLLRDQMLKGAVDSFTDEKRLVNKSGTSVWVNTTVSLVRSLDDSPSYVIAVMQDITERRAMEEQLRQSEKQRDAEREKAQLHVVRVNAELEVRVRQRTAELEKVNGELEAFSYSVSHDLRAPLTTIDGFANLLGRAEADHLSEKGKKYLLRIRAAAKDMGELIDGLLALARVSSNPLALSVQDLSAMAEHIIYASQEREPLRQVRVEIEPGLAAHGDRLLLTTALQNLLGNAWKFSANSDDALISMSSRVSADGERVYCVKDNGAGFDMATANKLFGTFERLHTSAEYAGTGIGLSIVKRVIERHGGRIWAQAQVNEGAAFYFTLGLVDIA